MQLKNIVKNKKNLFLLLVVLLIIFLFIKRRGNKSFDINKFDTEKVTVGDINKVVMANGIINPKDTVKISSQVPGNVEKIYVDFNDVVKKGQKLAKIETDVLERDLKSAEAALKQAESTLNIYKITYDREKELYKNNYIAKAEFDKAENDLVSARENHKIAKLKYEKARIELGQAYITSPVDGIVTSIDVSEGQMVTNGYTTTVMFQIAEDLSKMQIETSVSEADIGMINNDLKITFTVDAYKNKVFTGKIKQIRLLPALEQNVVVYTVIIDVENEEGLLLPGMTAYVSITIDSVKNVLRIPNTALRFKATKYIKTLLNMPEVSQEEKNYRARMIKDGKHVVLYVVRNGKPESILVEKGLSDLTYTEIKTDKLKEGDIILSSCLVEPQKKSKK